MTVYLPKPDAAVSGPGGLPTTTHHRWMREVTQAVNTPAATPDPTPAPEAQDFTISGAGSVTADGSVAGGEFVVTLANDQDSPPPTSYYGTDATQAKGFIALYDGFETNTGIALTHSGYVLVDTVATPDDLPLTGNAGEAVKVTDEAPGIYAWDGAAFTLDTAADGLVGVGLAPLADTATGTFKLLTRDAYGRVEGTQDGAAADVPYDNATSGLAATDVQAAIDEVAGTVFGSGVWTTVTKTTDESRSSTTTLANDSALTAALPANKTCLIRANIVFSAANATMDLKCAPAYTGTTSSIARRTVSQTQGASTTTDTVSIVFATLAPDLSNAAIYWAQYDLIVNTTSAGTFSFQWAQNTSDAAALKVLAGSYMEYTVL